MARTLVSMETLERRIAQVLLQYESCTDLTASVHGHEPDETECNWNIEYMRRSGNAGNVAMCRQAIDADVNALRARLNLAD